MIAAITNVRLARSDSAAESRKYWKKHGKKINIRKRQRRKSGTAKTAYTAGDYKWVTNTINQYQKNGISLKGLWKISSERPRLGLGIPQGLGGEARRSTASMWFDWTLPVHVCCIEGAIGAKLRLESRCGQVRVPKQTG